MSHREFKVEVVINVCNNFLEKRLERINEEREKLIYEELNKKWFYSCETREEAIKKLKTSDGIMDEWTACEWPGGKWTEKVQDLKSLCLANGSATVFVDAEMAFLFNE